MTLSSKEPVPVEMRYVRCQLWSRKLQRCFRLSCYLSVAQVRGYPYKRSHLVALRPTKISANDPPSTWWPGER